ncbi:MAG TPA: hypothetical protein VMB49_19980 [Acidobacteriaceae bacterium]|nr:hypothetical protein [Acidobacteriaceae bacterium]
MMKRPHVISALVHPIAWFGKAGGGKMEGAERIPQMCEIDRLAAMKRLQEKESLGFSGFLTVR